MEFAVGKLFLEQKLKEDNMKNGGGDSVVNAWLATRRWAITGSGNRRRVVETPGHAFIVVEKPEKVLALYKSDDDVNWITVAQKKTVAEAQVALLQCATEARVQWS